MFEVYSAKLYAYAYKWCSFKLQEMWIPFAKLYKNLDCWHKNRNVCLTSKSITKLKLEQSPLDDQLKIVMNELCLIV